MDDIWRFRQIHDHQFCPVCSVPHYPFCTPPPAFAAEAFPRCPPDLRPRFFHRPIYDRSPPPPFPVSQENGLSPFCHDEILERENIKRMRLEAATIRGTPNFRPFNHPFLVDDERRMNLIRDHGRQWTAQMQLEPQQISGDYEMDRHPHYETQNKYASGVFDHGFLGSALGYRDGNFPGVAYQGFRSTQVQSFQRDDRFGPWQRRDFEKVEFESDRRGAYNPPISGNPYGQGAHFDKTSQISPFHRHDEASRGWESFGESPLKDSSNRASDSTNEDKSLPTSNIHDQHQSQPLSSTSYLLPNQTTYCHTNDSHRIPYQQVSSTQNHMENKYEFHEHQKQAMKTSFEQWPSIPIESHQLLDLQSHPKVKELEYQNSKSSGYRPSSAEVKQMPGQGHIIEAQQASRPPLFPIQTDPSVMSLQVASSVPAKSSNTSPVRTSSSAMDKLSVYDLEQGLSTFAKLASDMGSPLISQPVLDTNEREHSFLSKHSCKEQVTYVDASHLFKRPYRASRPERIVIILRGLPGSGKSYLAKALRDIEVENGGCAPRIHAMDDYYMIEVEKVEENEGLKLAVPARGKKQVTKKVIEYCYEPEMEEAYRSSMLKAFKKTLDDGVFSFVIVDDRNLRVADFAQFWAIAKRMGYEVYVLEAKYKDPAGCAARNIHGFSLDDIKKMAEQWEEASSLYLHLDIQSLFGGDELNERSIQEVDMDEDDTVEHGHYLPETDDTKSLEPKPAEHDHGSTTVGKRWNTIEEELALENSKWSKDLDFDVHDSKSTPGNTNALSGLIQAYGKSIKCVHWGDKVETSGFSIGAIKKQCPSSLIIGRGAGYNLKTNPLPEDDAVGETTGKKNTETKRRFNEQMRAERESFRAVFDRRRQRIGGLFSADDEQ
ncbi:hypothetical protein HPP92_021413 [Vanilla planifolia]|uniref:YLP motif-containing protein 1 n=1 Tax=Vanilla planifolia TaxID=51239 RepID=A0A835UII0_VANPL|nr:hypothetical protein HPP92_021413 [Vanilla planifolia]